MASSSASVASRSRSSIGAVTKWPRVSSSASRSRPADSRSDGASGIDERKAESRVGWPTGPSQASNASKARAARREGMVHAAPAAGHFARDPGRQGAIEERHGGLALAARTALPVERRGRHHFAHPAEERGDGLETLPGRLEAIGDAARSRGSSDSARRRSLRRSTARDCDARSGRCRARPGRSPDARRRVPGPRRPGTPGPHPRPAPAVPRQFRRAAIASRRPRRPAPLATSPAAGRRARAGR